MKRILAAVADRLFSAPDTVCLERATLVTEAWRDHADEPTPIKRALALQHVLEHMTLDVTSNPIFAGNTSSRPRAWMLVPEHGLNVDAQVAIEHAELRHHLDGQIPQDLRDFWATRTTAGGVGHLAVDLDIVVNRGLASVLAQLSGADDPYRQAMVIALRAVIAWSHRLAAAAETAAASADAETAACHRRVAAACRRVPEFPARNLFEALQAITIVHLAIAIEGHRLSVSIGLPDRALARFAPEASSNPDAAADLVGGFLLAIAANAYLGRGSKTQAITVGGADHAGGDCCNAVTIAFLDAFDRVAVADPHLFLRWHGNLDVAVMSRALTMLSRGRSMPLLVNDAPTVRGFIAAGVTSRDAADYCVIGCNELGIPGRLFDSAVGIGCSFNDLDVLDRVLRDTPDPDSLDIDRLQQRLADAYEQTIGHGLSRRRREQERIAAEAPTPFTTSLMRGAASAGQDLMAAMPYRIPCVYTRGLSNAANAMATIEDQVFTQRQMTLSQLVSDLRADRPPASTAARWANDDDTADRWAERLVALRRQAIDRLVAAGLPRPVVCHVVRSLHHVDGARLGATPDGRRAGQPVGDSIGGITGTMAQGPTAVLASVLKLDAARDFAGGYNLNLTLPAGQADPPVLAGLITGFFDDAGQELQINVLDAARLREAQEHPERFRDLVVRVAGLSARFVELSKVEQDELIARAESDHCAPGR